MHSLKSSGIGLDRKSLDLAYENPAEFAKLVEKYSRKLLLISWSHMTPITPCPLLLPIVFLLQCDQAGPSTAFSPSRFLPTSPILLLIII